MSRSRCIILAAATLALCVAPVAAADDTNGKGRAVVVPAGPEITGLWFKTLFELPAAAHPFQGNGDPCVRLGRRGKVLTVATPATCTAEQGTAVYEGWDHWCSNFDPPDSPFYAVSAAEQRRCALAASQSVTALTITVDGRSTDILKRRFATFSPQIALNLPADNVFEIDPVVGPYTLTSYGWEVLVKNLRVGQHVIRIYGEDGDFKGSYEHIINIVPRAHSRDEDDHDDRH
jgi:hypothetical protein